MVGPARQRCGVALLLAALLALAAFPPPSVAAEAKTPSVGKQKGWASRDLPQPPPEASLDAGGPRRPTSSAVFPVRGDVYPHGLYYVAMSIGDPPKPYFLDVDTGSHLTWLQCDAPCVRCTEGPHPPYRPVKNKLVPCDHPLCAALHADTHQADERCDSPAQCDYEIGYADRGSSLGVLVADAFALRLTNGSLARPALAFGCGYDQQGAPQQTDGVLGLGGGAYGVLAQLRAKGITRSVVGHCFGRRGGGFLFFGDDLVPRSGIIWAPMTPIALQLLNPLSFLLVLHVSVGAELTAGSVLIEFSTDHYSPGLASLFFGKQFLGVKDVPMVIDSGSSYSYFTLLPYQALVSAVKKELSGKPLTEAYEDPTLPLCWKGTKPFKSLADVGKYFKSLVLSFMNGKRPNFEVPPENYLIITKRGNACLGILNGTEVGLRDVNVIGDIAMQDLMVIYDNENHQIGWGRAHCDRLPKSGTSLL